MSDLTFKESAILEYLRVMGVEGLADATDDTGRPVLTYNGNLIADEKQALDLYTSWWRILLPFMTKRQTKPIALNSEEDTVFKDYDIASSPDRNWVTDSIGWNIKHKYFRYLVTVLAPPIYIVRALVKTLANLGRLFLEFPLSLAALYFKHCLDDLRPKENENSLEQSSEVEGNAATKRHIKVVFFHVMRFICNFMLMFARAITSINRGPELAYHDMLRYCLENKNFEDHKHEVVDLNVPSGKYDSQLVYDSLPHYYQNKYEDPSTGIKFFAMLARAATFVSMIAFWCSILALVMPLIPVLGPFLAPVLAKYLFIEKGFELLGLVISAAIAKYAIGAAIFSALTLGYKIVRSTCDQIINSAIAADSITHFNKKFFRSSLAGCLATLGFNPKRVYLEIKPDENKVGFYEPKPSPHVLVNNLTNIPVAASIEPIRRKRW